MLATHPIDPMILATDLGVAGKFYGDRIGLEVLANLQRLDQVAYVRFASVYKDFQEIGDFEREFGLMLQKKESKARSR